MFSRHIAASEPDGTIFIDRNGHLFSHVLEFLRNGHRWAVPDVVDRSALLNEAEYFGLQGMVDKLVPPAPSSVKLKNTRRVGSVLTLVDPTDFGEAKFHSCAGQLCTHYAHMSREVWSRPVAGRTRSGDTADEARGVTV